MEVDCSSAGDSFWIRKIMRNKLDSSFGTLYNYNFHKKKLLSCMGSYAMHSAFQR